MRLAGTQMQTIVRCMWREPPEQDGIGSFPAAADSSERKAHPLSEPLRMPCWLHPNAVPGPWLPLHAICKGWHESKAAAPAFVPAAPVVLGPQCILSFKGALLPLPSPCMPDIRTM